jgi:predicted SAM-dependent methyltransferase
MLNNLKTLIATRLAGLLAARLPDNVWDYLLSRERGGGRILKKAARQFTFDRALLSELFVRGEGIEIGAFDTPMAVPEGVRVLYVDRASAGELVTHAPGVESVVAPDIVDDAQTLATVADSSQDFVIAAHVIEHMEDPIGAVGNWLRVLKPGGILFLAIPDKRFTFDINREVTSFSHLLRDHEEGPEWSRQAHYEEAFRLIAGVSDEQEISRLAEEHRRKVGHTHFHVWAQADMFELLAALRKQVGLEFEIVASAAGNEVVFVLRKGDAGLDRSGGEMSLRKEREQFAALRA